MIVRSIGDAFLLAAYLVDGESFFKTKDIHYLVVVVVIYKLLAHQSFVQKALAYGKDARVQTF